MKRIIKIAVIIIPVTIILAASAVFFIISRPGKENKPIIHIGVEPALNSISGEIVSIAPMTRQVTIKTGLPLKYMTFTGEPSLLFSFKNGDLVTITTEYRKTEIKSMEIFKEEPPKKKRKRRKRE